MTLRRALLHFIGWSVFLFLLSCLGIGIPGDIAVALIAGWAWFIVRSAERVTVHWGEIAVGTVSVVLLAFTLHRFLYSLYPAIARRPAESGLRWRPQWTMAAVSVTVLTFCAGISLIGITHQIVWMISSKERFMVNNDGMSAARRSQSKNNLKQIGLALHNYHEVASVLPPGGTFDQSGQPCHSWQTFVIPFLDHVPLYNQINFHVPWDHPRNAEFFRVKLSVFWNPAVSSDRTVDDKQAYGTSHYAANGWVLGGNTVSRFPAFTDGLSNTFLGGEVAGNFKPWGDPTNWRDPQLGINKSPDGFGSPYKGGAHFLMGDGAVRFISENIDSKVLKALSTPAGGESMDNVDF